MRTTDNETSAAAPSGDLRLLRFIRCFRILAIFLTLIAAVSMGFSKQTNKSVSFNSLTGKTTYISISVEATDSSSFLYFIVANVLVFVWSVVLTVFSFMRKYGAARLQLPVAIIDLVSVIILSTANAAAAVTEELASNGNSHYGWEKFCNLTKIYCGVVIATTVISSLAAAFYFVMVVFSIVIFHRRSQ